MSAYLCSRAHIATLVSFAERTQCLGYHATLAGAASMLEAQNVASVNYRYRDSPGYAPASVEPYTVSEVPRLARPNVSAVEVIKLLQCLEYQCCETDDYKETSAHTWIDNVLSCAIRKLPGYDAAPWGME